MNAGKFKIEYKVKKEGTWKVLYILFAILTVASLLLATRGIRIPCMVFSTLGFVGMAAINSILGFKSVQKSYFLSPDFRKDVGILVIWMFLLGIWAAN